MSDQVAYVRNCFVRIEEFLQKSQMESQLADTGCLSRKQMVVSRQGLTSVQCFFIQND